MKNLLIKVSLMTCLLYTNLDFAAQWTSKKECIDSRKCLSGSCIKKDNSEVWQCDGPKVRVFNKTSDTITAKVKYWDWKKQNYVDITQNVPPNSQIKKDFDDSSIKSKPAYIKQIMVLKNGTCQAYKCFNVTSECEKCGNAATVTENKDSLRVQNVTVYVHKDDKGSLFVEMRDGLTGDEISSETRSDLAMRNAQEDEKKEDKLSNEKKLKEDAKKTSEEKKQLEIVKKIADINHTHAQTNKVLGQTASLNQKPTTVVVNQTKTAITPLVTTPFISTPIVNTLNPNIISPVAHTIATPVTINP